MPHIHDKIDFTASVFIVNNNAVLLRKHEKFHRWLQPGGHIELDEDPNEAVIREAKEETGLDVVLVGEIPPVSEGIGYKNLIPPRFMNRHSFKIKEGHEHIDLVYFGTSATREINPHSGEIPVEIRWFTRDELDDPQYDLFESTKYYAKVALKELSVTK